MSGNVSIIDEEGGSTASSAGVDSLGNTKDTVLVKDYDSKDAAILKLFFDKELIEIGQVGRVTLEPPQGPGLKLLIKCKESRKERIDPLIKDLDTNLGTIEVREVTVPNDAFAKLAEHMRSEEKRQIDAQQKERVLYRPDIVKKLVNIYFWPGNEKAVLKLRLNDKLIEVSSDRFYIVDHWQNI